MPRYEVADPTSVLKCLSFSEGQVEPKFTTRSQNGKGDALFLQSKEQTLHEEREIIEGHGEKELVWKILPASSDELCAVRRNGDIKVYYQGPCFELWVGQCPHIRTDVSVMCCSHVGSVMAILPCLEAGGRRKQKFRAWLLQSNRIIASCLHERQRRREVRQTLQLLRGDSRYLFYQL